MSELSKAESRGVEIQVLEEANLSARHKEKTVEEIRRIKPQSRGSVVASGGQVLPISGSKKLNLVNTPVLLIKEVTGKSDSTPLYVFPCKVGERYYGVLDGISFLLSSLPNPGELPGEMEETLVALLKSDPQKLETGLQLRSSEESLSTGKADLIFQDSQSRVLIVEVEREATDAAVGQILRLAAGYEKDRAVERVRCGIACFRMNTNVLVACERSGIEVWRSEEQGKRFLKISR